MYYRMTDIKNFVATATCRTIMEASSKLEISQPALSESLKRLEKDVKSVLLYRSRSGIQLTPSGKVFLSRANVLLSAYNNLNLESDGSIIFAERSISIGCHQTVAQYTLPQSLLKIKNKAPDYNIEIIHDLSRNIQNQVQKGNVDIGIVINPVQVPDLIIHKLSTDQVGVWSSSSEFDKETIICNMNLFQTQSILKRWKNRPRRILSTESLELITQLVATGIGYGIAPAKAVELSKVKLKKINNLPVYNDDIAIVYRPEFGKIESEKIVIASLKEALLNK